MKIDEIKAIVRMMSEHDLTEFKVEAEEYNLCIKRGGKAATQLVAAPMLSAPVMPAAPAPAVSAAPVAAAPAPEKTRSIESPLVGTFYRSNSPDAAPFVQVGDKVTADTTVCIIEAMKVMNEVKAEKAGVVKEVLAENGQPVEYGQALFILE